MLPSFTSLHRKWTLVEVREPSAPTLTSPVLQKDLWVPPQYSLLLYCFSSSLLSGTESLCGFPPVTTRINKKAQILVSMFPRKKSIWFAKNSATEIISPCPSEFLLCKDAEASLDFKHDYLSPKLFLSNLFSGSKTHRTRILTVCQQRKAECDIPPRGQWTWGTCTYSLQIIKTKTWVQTKVSYPFRELWNLSCMSVFNYVVNNMDN